MDGQDGYCKPLKWNVLFMKENFKDKLRAELISNVRLFLVVMLFLLSNVAIARSESLIFEADFNGGDNFKENGLTFSGNRNAKIVKEDFLGDSPALKISLHRFKDEVSYRSEMGPKNLPAPYFKKGKHGVIGAEYWYSFRIFFPKEWKFDQEREIIAQWHGMPDFELGENWRNPPISLMIGTGQSGVGKNYFLVVHADSKELTPDKRGLGRYTFNREEDLGSIISDLGKWTEWVFHIKWSYKDDGFLIVWKDGEKALDFKKLPNCFNDKLGPYFHFGVYKWPWKEGGANYKPPYGIDERILYFDDIRIGGENATYNDVSIIYNDGL